MNGGLVLFFSTVQEQGGIQSPNNYRGVMFFRHIMDGWERVIKMIMRREMVISDNQFGPRAVDDGGHSLAKEIDGTL